MALYSDMNGFPESGFPVLVDVEDRLTLNTLHYSPIKHLGYKLDVVGNNRLLGALTLGGAITGATSITMAGSLSGVTTLGMNGALSGVSTIGASGDVTLSGGNLLLTTGQIGNIVSPIKKAWIKDLNLKNRPTVDDIDKVALVSDLAYLQSRSIRVGNTLGYTEISEDGTMTFYGTATLFDDLTGDITRTRTTGTRCTLNDVENTIDFTNAGTLTDYIFLNYQMSHKWKSGSAVHPHIHWEQASNQTPNWLVQYRWQSNGGVKTTAWTNYVCNINAFTYVSGNIQQISGGSALNPPVGYGISDIIQIRVIRDTGNNSGAFAGIDTYGSTASVMSVDIHYEIDQLGSRTEYVK